MELGSLPPSALVALVAEHVDERDPVGAIAAELGLRFEQYSDFLAQLRMVAWLLLYEPESSADLVAQLEEHIDPAEPRAELIREITARLLTNSYYLTSIVDETCEFLRSQLTNDAGTRSS